MVLVEKCCPLSVKVRVRFYESWDNGDPLTTRFKFEDGTRAHARVPARYMCRVIAEPVPCDKRGRVKLNDRDLSEYLNEVDYLAKRLNASGGRKQQQKKVLRKTNSDYVRFVSMFYFQFVPYCVRHMLFFQFVPYVLAIRYFFSLCHMC